MGNLWNNPDTETKHCGSLEPLLWNVVLFKTETMLHVLLAFFFISSCELLHHFDIIEFIAYIIIIKQSLQAWILGFRAEWQLNKKRARESNDKVWKRHPAMCACLRAKMGWSDASRGRSRNPCNNRGGLWLHRPICKNRVLIICLNFEVYLIQLQTHCVFCI